MAASDRSRWPMFARLLWRSLTVRAGRVGVALGALAVGAAVVSALLCLYLDIKVKMAEELRAYGANFVVGAPMGGSERGVDQADLQRAVAAVPGERLVGASPVLYGVVRLDQGNAVIAGVDFPGLRRVSPYWQVAGGWIGVSFDERNAMIGRKLAETMEIRLGDTLNVLGEATGERAHLTVKGIIDTGDAEDEQMFVALPLAQRLLGLPGRADFALLSVTVEGAEADALASSIDAAAPGVEARPIRKISESDGVILDKIDGLMAVVAAFILVMTTLCVNATLTAMVAERAPEIGLEKALGAGHRAIVAQFVGETVAIGIVGTLIGLGLGFGLAQILGQAVFGGWVDFRAAVIPVALAASLLTALAAAVVPVRRAVRIAPARVLRGE